MPHQGFVNLSVSLFTLAVTLGILYGILRREKKQRESNTDDH